MKIITRLSVLVAVAGLSALASTASAQRISPMTAGNFGRICTSRGGAQICDAYITGMADAGALSKINAVNNGDASAQAGFCIPQSTTGTDLRSKVVSWLKAHKDELSKPVGETVFVALHESYPCGTGK